MAKSLFSMRSRSHSGSDGSRKVSLGTQEVDYLTQNTELKDREALRSYFDTFIAKHPKGCISRKEFRDLARQCYPNKNYAKIEKRFVDSKLIAWFIYESEN